MLGPVLHDAVAGLKMSVLTWPRPLPDPPPLTSSRPSGSQLCPLQNMISEIGLAVKRPVAGSNTCGIALVPPKTSTLPSSNRLWCTSTIGASSTADHWPSVAAPPVTTVTLALPVMPSLVALIVVVPPATPVTRPVDDTDAVLGATDAQVTIRPVRMFPCASFGVAVSCTVPPRGTFDDAGVPSTDATAPEFDVTVMLALPLIPSLVAVIVAAPTATPVTRPVADTVANWGALLDQVFVRPSSGSPTASFVVAVSCSVVPTGTSAVAGLTSTDATGTTGPAWPALISTPNAPAALLAHVASIVLSLVAHSANRSPVVASPEGCSSILVNPAPAEAIGVALAMPNTP